MPENFLSDEKRDFITLCAEREVLVVSESGFVMKGGRKGVYYLNCGKLMQDAQGLTLLSNIYTTIIGNNFCNSQGQIDASVICGLAYKGIPIGACLTTEILRRTGQNMGFVHDRKEDKLHGADSGGLSGKPIGGERCIMVDDVLTVGTAAQIAIEKILLAGGTIGGMVVLFDRQEVIETDSIPRISAAMSLAEKTGVKIVSYLTYKDIRQAIREGIIGNSRIGEMMDRYFEEYGAEVSSNCVIQ